MNKLAFVLGQYCKKADYPPWMTPGEYAGMTQSLTNQPSVMSNEEPYDPTLAEQPLIEHMRGYNTTRKPFSAIAPDKIPGWQRSILGGMQNYFMRPNMLQKARYSITGKMPADPVATEKAKNIGEFLRNQEFLAR